MKKYMLLIPILFICTTAFARQVEKLSQIDKDTISVVYDDGSTETHSVSGILENYQIHGFYLKYIQTTMTELQQVINLCKAQGIIASDESNVAQNTGGLDA